jgi:hypothetical protein
MSIEKMPIYKEKNNQAMETEDRMRAVVDTAMREIRKVVHMPGKGIDERGMSEVVQSLKRVLEKNNMLNWNDVFEHINQGVRKEVDRLRLEGSRQAVSEKVTRTQRAWQYIAKNVLNREYMLPQEKSNNE